MTQYSEKSYKMASDNTKYNDDGKAVISENDEWRDEKEWDEVFEQMQRSCVIYLEIMLQWETKNALVVRIFILLPILLLTGSNNLLHLALICHNL